MTEDTPSQRVPHSNFYFPQEDLIATWAARHNTSWTVTRPGFIIGANPTAAINISYPLAIYASVQTELGLKLEFPSDIGAWDINKDLTTASLLGYFSEWAVLTDAAKDEALNIVDDSPFSYGKFWPTLASWYGIEYSTPVEDEGKYMVVTMPRNPPPRGFGKPGEVKVRFSFEAWAQKSEVKTAWEKIQEREGLKKELDPWREKESLVNVFGTLDAEILGSWARYVMLPCSEFLQYESRSSPLNNADLCVHLEQRRWTKRRSSDEGLKATIQRMAELKMVSAI